MVQALVGKDGSNLAVSGFDLSDWNIQGGTVLEMNETADGNYSLSLDLNNSLEASILSLMLTRLLIMTESHRNLFEKKFICTNWCMTRNIFEPMGFR